MTRRDFLTIPADGVSAAVITVLGATLLEAQNKVEVPLRFFTRPQAAVVEAACERIMPADENGPGAKDTGVVIYIDRQLAGPWGHDKYRYTQAPFVESLPEHGYQGKENPREIYVAGLEKLGDFTALSAEEQDQKLITIERTPFFQMLRAHTLQGMFCDPLHGGNAGMAGWKMVGFPGPYMSWREEVDKHFRQAYVVPPRSLSEVMGREFKGIEDEPL
jgi:gluconate 2-dehydrogenase gamma chain